VAKPVEPGARIGALRSIRAGLAADDRVVVSGAQYALPGSKVALRETRVELADAPPGARAYAAPPPSQATIAAR
jgi:hypothetical protein